MNIPFVDARIVVGMPVYNAADTVAPDPAQSPTWETVPSHGRPHAETVAVPARSILPRVTSPAR